MRDQKEPRFHRTDMWREGKWLDLWSVVHFFSGLSIGFTFAMLRVPHLPAVVIALLALTMYEMWEALANIHETPQNRVMDIVVGMVSFSLAFFLLATLQTTYHLMVTFIVTLIVNIGLSVLGWRASQKAAELERRMRARYQLERARLLRRGSQLRKKLRTRNRNTF